MYELASVETYEQDSGFDCFEKPKKRRSEGFVVVRCGGCDCLHTVSARHARRETLCRPCSHGKTPEPREAYYVFWLERFTAEEIRQMAIAIWGRFK